MIQATNLKRETKKTENFSSSHVKPNLQRVAYTLLDLFLYIVLNV